MLGRGFLLPVKPFPLPQTLMVGLQSLWFSCLVDSSVYSCSRTFCPRFFAAVLPAPLFFAPPDFGALTSPRDRCFLAQTFFPPISSWGLARPPGPPSLLRCHGPSSFRGCVLFFIPCFHRSIFTPMRSHFTFRWPLCFGHRLVPVPPCSSVGLFFPGGPLGAPALCTLLRPASFFFANQSPGLSIRGHLNFSAAFPGPPCSSLFPGIVFGEAFFIFRTRTARF